MTETELLSTFSKNLKRIIDQEQITQEELADEIGVTQSTISKYINGQRLPSILVLIQLSDFLCYSLDEFFE